MNELRRPSGANKRRKIVGRGPGSGSGKTSGRGQKGQRARNTSPRPGFEGGQTPLYRRLPSRGFSNYDYRVRYEIVSLGAIEKKFENGQVVSYETLYEKGLVGSKFKKVKILSDGEITKKVSFEVSKLSKKAEEFVKKIGCSVKLV